MERFTAKASAAPELPRSGTVTMSGSMTIEHGQCIRQNFLEALRPATTVVLDLERVEGIDLTGLQLICSLHRSLTEQGTRLVIHGSENPVVSGVVQAAGYQHARCSAASSGGCALCHPAGTPQKEVAQ